jgi:hypothetical protein
LRKKLIRYFGLIFDHFALTRLHNPLKISGSALKYPTTAYESPSHFFRCGGCWRITAEVSRARPALFHLMFILDLTLPEAALLSTSGIIIQ